MLDLFDLDNRFKKFFPEKEDLFSFLVDELDCEADENVRGIEFSDTLPDLLIDGCSKSSSNGFSLLCP